MASADRNCHTCGGPCVTLPSASYPTGRPIEGAANCERCARGRIEAAGTRRGTARMSQGPTHAETILAALERGPAEVARLSMATGLPRERVRERLSHMKQRGEVRKTREGWART